MSLESLLAQDTITVERPVISSDGAGGFNQEIWSPVAVGVLARVDIANGQQKSMFAQLQIEVSHTVFTQYGGIKNGDRITSSDGEIYRVVGISRRKAFGGIPEYYEIATVQILDSGPPEILPSVNYMKYDELANTYMMHGTGVDDFLLWG